MPDETQAEEYILLPPRGVRARLEDDSRAFNMLSSMPVTTSTAPPRRATLTEAPNVGFTVIDTVHENGPKLVQLTAPEVQALRQQETGLRLVRQRYYNLDLALAAQVHPPPGASHGPDIVLTIVSAADGRSVAGAEVLAYTDFINKLGAFGTTDQHGKCSLKLGTGNVSAARLYVRPPLAGFWGVYRPSIALSTGAVIALEKVDLTQQDALRSIYGNANTNDGVGVKVAVIDSGIDLSHSDLKVADGRNTVKGEPKNSYDDNGEGHGTHVAGIIGARGTQPNGLRGLAPGVELCSYRVFGQGVKTATSYAIMKAIIYAADSGCDLINVSLGETQEDESLRDAIEDARDNGSLVVAAAGNGYRKQVSVPARYDYAIAVSAMGILSTFPPGSLHDCEVETPFGTDPDHFIASFSNIGLYVDLTAPGVGIISTVPGGYGPMSGTSMACPAVVGMAARLLAQDPVLQSMPRDRSRGNAFAQRVRQAARKMGFGYNYEGFGML